MRARTPTIHCDGDYCDNWSVDFYEANASTVNGYRISREVRAPLWVCDDTNDYCPECVQIADEMAARAAGSGRAAERVEGPIKLGANPAEETEPIHMGWMSSFTPELQDAITAAANCPCSSYPCTCQRADQTQEGDR